MKLQRQVFFLALAVVAIASSWSLTSINANRKLTAAISDAFTSNQTIRSVLVIDADTDTSIGELTDGSVISLEGGKKYTFQAITSPETVGSVLFEINGKKRSDSNAPYAMYRDNGKGNFYPAPLSAGNYTLTTRTFTLPKAKGVDGAPITIRFSVVESGSGTIGDRSPDHPSNNLKVFLGGPYSETPGLMTTGLNDSNLIPLTEPYTALGYTLTSGANSTIQSSVLVPTGDDAIIDWIIVELRSATNPATVVASKPALVEADGDVMSTDGMTPILGTFTPGTYYVAVRHRNHLAIMTHDAMDITGVVDMSSEPLYGTSPAKTVNGLHVMWPGDVSRNGEIKYTGTGNDRDIILTTVGSTNPNNQVFNAYSSADVNMDGIVKYTGTGNDRDIILVSVGSTTPTNTLFAQLPTSTSGATYYASPTGTGNGLSANTPFQISNFWSVAQPGSTLVLLNGVYTGANSMIDPPDNLSGTSGSPITVRAMNDGMARIDGQGVRLPVTLSYNNWFVLEGFNANNSSGSVVSLGYSSNNIVRRVVAWDAGSTGDNNIFGVHHGTYNLLEDVAGFGAGVRKTFSNSQGGDNTTFRRAFGRWEGADVQGPKKTFALSYNSYNALCENCIGTWDSLGMPASYNLMEYNGTQVSPTQSFTNYQVQNPNGIFSHDAFDDSFLADGNSDNPNIRIFGSIAYLKPDERYHNVPSPSRDWAGPVALEIKGVQLKDSVSIIEPGSHTNIWNPYLGDVGVTGLNSATNSTFVGGEGAHINNKWTTSGNYISSSCGSVTANGGNVVNHQGTLTGGATVMKRYVDGVLTNDDLWPWPMNQRIIDAMTTAGYTGEKIIDVTATINGLCGATSSSQPTLAQIASVGQQWLAASGSARTALEPQLAAWTTNIDEAVDLIRPHTYTTQPTGEVFNQQFSLPSLVARYPGWNDPFTPATENYKPEFNMVVPANYNPNTPMGIMFFLHWGGGFLPEDLDYPATPDPNDSYITEWVLDDESVTGRSVVRKESDNSNFIVVAPVAPFGYMIPAGTNPANNYYQHNSRWNVPSADQYLMDIITEIASRYNVDYNKVVVTGSSMGGIGAYHIAHRLNDRLSAVMANGGSWTLGSWSSITDLPVYTIHGTNDAYWGGTSGSCRNHMTAVEFPRKAHQLMGANNPYDTLTEYPQIPGHGFDTSYNTTEPGALAWKAFVNGTSGLVHGYTRNPYRSHVIAINPWRTYDQGGNYDYSWSEDPSPDTMWLSINSYGPGTISYNRVTPQGDGGCSNQTNWNNWSLVSDTVNLPGGKAEATITGPNAINVTTTNVTSLSLWLHPSMVNISQPINVTVNGLTTARSCGTSTSLLTALKSYERRQDWEMIYHCKIDITP